MALDPSILLSYKNPVIQDPLDRQQKMMTLKNLQDQDAFNQLKVDEYNRKRQDDDAMRGIIQQSGGDFKKARDMLLQGGYLDKAQEIDKYLWEQGKNQAEIDSKGIETARNKLDLFGQHAGYVMQNPTPEAAFNSVKQLIGFEVITPEKGQEILSQMPSTSDGIKAWATQGYQSALAAKDQLPKTDKYDIGGAINTVSTDIYGKPTVTGTFNKTQTPDNIANNERTVSENLLNRNAENERAALSRGVQIRGQNMTDARSKEANALKLQGGPVKPLSAAALKMQNEGLDAIGIANSIDADLGALQSKLEQGKLDLGPLSNAWSATKNYAGASDENSRNFATFKATIEKLRNDSLKLNKGVQTEGDAQRAWNELLSSINDTELVKQRLVEIRGINKRAAELQKLNVDNVRANYNQPPMDYSGYENKKSPLSSGPSSPPKVGTIIDGWLFSGGNPADKNNWKKATK